MRTQIAAIILCTSFLACDRPAPKAGAAPGGMPPLATAPGPKAPAAPSAPPAAGTLTGTVLETIDAASYTYLRIGTPSGEQWAAVSQAQVAKGSQVTVVNAVPMDGFESKTLKRKFDHIVFGSLAAGNAAPAKDDPTANMGAQHAAAAAGPSEVEVGKVDKATGPGAATIAEVFAKKTALKDKNVAIRGKVVKFNAGIMGKNWLHLRDGSGDAKQGNHDITVTTKDLVKVGDLVVVNGPVHLDRDFGAGYAYPVIVEDAKLAQ